jgi:hypothetical protein
LRFEIKRLGILVVTGLLLIGCQRQSEVELTLVAQNLALETQIVAVRETATVDAERLQITMEYMGTLVGRAEEQRALLQATLVARGTSPANLENVDPALVTPLATPDPGAANNALPLVTVAPEGTPTEIPDVPTLVDVVMAAGVGSNDCAVNPTNEFTTATAEIYIVATAVNIAPGTNIAARFSVAGQEIRHDFTPDFEIDGNCVWFFIDQTDATFTAGTWSVQLELDGTPVTSPIAFTITEAS